MLELKGITKQYGSDENAVLALKGVSLKFRKSEFVAILGSSGCGKTTMLNIIGGLDRYTDGDLVIAGKSTKAFKDRDWDTYRNNSIGFVFQNYNLISHQTVLANVEMALTLAGVSAKERKRRAIEALEKVGLSDKLKKRPNQLSGGQMQRVAIARALINDPEIILADEPTGALDSETSIQVMDLLKEVAKDRLVIMVTHNGELANRYSTRIVRLSDGEVVDDSNPLTEEDENVLVEQYVEREKQTKGKRKKTSMSFFTAFALSLKNLLTKKTRTFLTAFAGSIGIIGVALVLAVSSGVSGYINRLQKDTLATYPLTINRSSMDMTSMLSMVMGMDKASGNKEEYTDKKLVWIKQQVLDMFAKLNQTNDLETAKAVLDERVDKDLYYAIMENYSAQLNIFAKTTLQKPNQTATGYEEYPGYFRALSSDKISTTSPLVDSVDLLESQYDIDGDWPKPMYQNEDGDWVAEAVMSVDSYNSIVDISALFLWGEMPTFAEDPVYTFEDIKGKEFKAIINDNFFTPADGKAPEISDSYKANQKAYTLPNSEGYAEFLRSFGFGTYETTEEVWNAPGNVIIKITGIVRMREDTEMGIISTPLAYHSSLTKFMIDNAKTSNVVERQIDKIAEAVMNGNNAFTDIVTGMEYDFVDEKTVLATMGYAAAPSQLAIYPKNFECKEQIKDIIDGYNEEVKEYNKGLTQEEINSGKKKQEIQYSDIMEALMGMLTSLIDIVTYALVGFTSVSLVVSTIMIGIITYVSVLERTKEIGLLRALGARKRDISRVFNAETTVIGFAAGAIGMIISLLFALIMNAILAPLTGIPTLVNVLPMHAVLLIAISVMLTLVAGLIPSSIAAKKDPVAALRSE